MNKMHTILLGTFGALLTLSSCATGSESEPATEKTVEQIEVVTEESAQSETPQSETVARDINLAEFDQIVADKKPLILDVRTPEEFAEGAIPEAINLDVLQANFRNEVVNHDKTQPVIVYCRSGKRSENAMGIMKELGFLEVYNLEGGYMNYSANHK